MPATGFRFPFTALVGQEPLKQSLMLGAVNPAIGGVLIRGEKGTAKSTAVRGLADLLPDIEVVRGCAFACHPDHPASACDHCRSSAAPQSRSVIRRRVAVVDLPLNATEDRVAGGIDFTATLQTGHRTLQPGLLAAAHRGILYVDEVNLLDDHLVDLILDAAACGQNVIEREGISRRHPAAFILVGTMNPEEGELRPQLLDRFGLCVETQGAPSAEERVALMERREAFDADPVAFRAQAAAAQARLARRLEEARKRLRRVRLPGPIKGFIAELCTENQVAGHRADLVMAQAALAQAALEGTDTVTVDHVRQVAPFVLVHRRREAQPPPPPSPPPPEDDQNEEEASQDEAPQDEAPPNGAAQNEAGQEAQQDTQGSPPPSDAPEGPDEDQAPDAASSEAAPAAASQPENTPERIFEIGATFKVKPIAAVKDRLFRRGSGRRSRTRVSQKQGRYVKSCLTPRHGDIALDATLRAAAPHQRYRRNGGRNSGRSGDLCIHLTRDDLRGKIREKRVGNCLIFLVDASGSMGARGRMAASKGAVMSLLLDAYQKRDRVALISFRRDEAVVNLPPTPSVELAGKLLAEMPVGGRTPLSAGLAKCFEQVRNQLLKDPAARPIVILITDGKSNVALGDAKPMAEVRRLAAAMAHDERVAHIVVDTEEAGLVTFGLARQLAGDLKAQYFKIDDLKAQSLVNILKGQHP